MQVLVAVEHFAVLPKFRTRMQSQTILEFCGESNNLGENGCRVQFRIPAALAKPPFGPTWNVGTETMLGLLTPPPPTSWTRPVLRPQPVSEIRWPLPYRLPPIFFSGISDPISIVPP